MATKKTWLYVRLAVVAFGAASGPTILNPQAVAESNVDWLACLAILAFTPVALLFVVGIQAVNPYSAKIWTRPSWYANPFNLRQPLQFFHPSAFFFMAGGVAAIPALPWAGVSAAPLAFILLTCGVGALLGVCLCVVTFRSKIADSETQKRLIDEQFEDSVGDKIKKHWKKWLLATGFVVGLYFVINQITKSTGAYEYAEYFIENDRSLQHLVGNSIQLGFFPSGSMSEVGDHGTASFTINIKGTLDSGKVSLYLKKEHDDWVVIHATYLSKAGKRTDLQTAD
jgi:hypothetical protein